MKKHKLFKPVLISVLLAAAAASVMTGCGGAGGGAAGGASKGLEASYKYAEAKVKDYDQHQVLYDADFSDKVFSTAGTAAMLVNEKTSQEDFEKISHYLFVDSITLTDGEGKILVSYPENEKGKKLKETKDKKEFKRLATGMAVKQMSEPKRGDDGNYTLYAGVNRGEEGGAVIVGITTDEYAKVTGETLADSCGVNTVVLKDGEVLSSTLEQVKAGDKADKLGIKDEDVKKGSLDLKVDGKEYNGKAGTVESYTLITAEPK